MGSQDVVGTPHLLRRLPKWWRGRFAKPLGPKGCEGSNPSSSAIAQPENVLREFEGDGRSQLIKNYIWKFDKKSNFWYNIYIRLRKEKGIKSADTPSLRTWNRGTSQLSPNGQRAYIEHRPLHGETKLNSNNSTLISMVGLMRSQLQARSRQVKDETIQQYLCGSHDLWNFGYRIGSHGMGWSYYQNF